MIADSPHPVSDNEKHAQPELENDEALPEISFHAIARTNHPQTIRVLGKLKNKNIIVLIDGGSTHNFIDQATVTKYGLPMIRNKKLQVTVANQEKIDCMVCHLVLGVQWLETLGPIEMNYNQLTMTFKVGETSHTFQGLKHTGVAALREKEINNLQA